MDSSWRGVVGLAHRSPPGVGAQDSGEVVAGRLVQLTVAAALGVAVGAPPFEVRGVPEAPALHVVVLHLQHPLGAQRGEAEVLALAPSALGAGHAVGVGGEELVPPAPRVVGDVADQRLELLPQLGAPRRREAGRDPDVLELAVVVVQPEQQRADQRLLGRGGLVLAVAGEHDVGGALVLDLEHGALVGLVRRPERLGDDTVEPGALELLEPPLGLGRVLGGAGQEAGAGAVEVAERLDQRLASLGEGPVHEGLVAQRQQVEGHEAGGRLDGQLVDAAGGGVDPLLQGLELQPPALGALEADEDLAVQHDAVGKLAAYGLDDLGEVARERLGVAARELDLVAVLEDQAAEPVPLRLEAQARRAWPGPARR